LHSSGGSLLLVGHDAFPAGAQMLLLHLARQFRRANGVTLEILLGGGGALVAEYASIAPTTILEDADARSAHLRTATSRGVRAAIVNTCAAAEAVPILDRAGVPTTLLVHELPRLIAERGWQQAAREAAQHARRIVFAAECVRDGFATIATPDPARVLLRSQGCYRPAPFSAAARARGPALLDLPERAKLVLGIGYADLRKGFDLFLQAWRAVRLRDDAVVFCWVGAIDPQLRSWLGAEIEAALATDRFRLPGFRDDIPDVLAAADVLALTSREDPFPSVMLEALSSGLPVVAFDGGEELPPILLPAEHAPFRWATPPPCRGVACGLCAICR
jgi:glycosyltransferase involved in cell wall biosynthesis